jgi:cobalamin biosynthesis protein CobT
MSSFYGNYAQSDVQDALAVVGQGMAKDYGIKVVWGKEGKVRIDLENKIAYIPKLACASGDNFGAGKGDFEEALMLTRANVGHEFGHGAHTKLAKKDYPKGALFSILNALEDVRMERAVAEDYLGFGKVFSEAKEWHNKKIAQDVLDGKVQGIPLWEANCACIFQVGGVAPAWNLSEQAKMYFDAMYEEFSEVRNAKNTGDCLKIAKKIYEILKNLLNDQEEKNQPNESGEGDGADGEEGEEEKEDKQQKQQQEGNGKQKQQKKQQKKEKGEKGKEKGQEKSSGGEMEDEKEEKGNGKGEEGEEEKEGKDSGKGEEGEEGEGEEKGKGQGEEGEEEGEDEGEGSGNGEGMSDEEVEGDDSGKEESNSCKEKHGFENYDPKNSGNCPDGDGSNGLEKEDEEELEARLNKESEGQDLTERANEVIEKAMDLADKRGVYTSRRDLDEHRVPEPGDAGKVRFNANFERMQAEVAAMTMALEQALRAITRSRKDQFLRYGRIDGSRMVEIAKGLSKEIFYQKRPGKELSTVVSMVIDQSGSMSCCSQVRDLVILLGECLSRLGIRFEVVGTTTKFEGGSCPSLDTFTRTNPIVYDHYKDLGEQWGVVRHRMMSVGAFKHNIDGEAVEYCAKRLSQQPEARKIIFSLCDGEPCGGQGNDEDLGENIKSVSDRAWKAGIEVYGVGLGTKRPAQYYGNNHFIYLDGNEGMGQKFVRAFAEILTQGKVQL